LTQKETDPQTRKMKVLIRHSVCAFLAVLMNSISNSGFAQRPNIIVIFTDDQTYRAIGYNSDDVKTPHLDRLANEGIIFNKAFVASPICAASRASMMTGVFPQQHGVIALASKEFNKYMKGGTRADQTLPFRLREAGYRCAFWGKSHLGDPKAYGFGEGAELQGYDDTETFARARTFLTGAAGDTIPFFLWIAPRQPHVPLKPSQEWLRLYDEHNLTPGVNFRENPLPESINNQGIPGELYYRDSDYTNNWKDLPAGPPRDESVIRLFTKAYYATISHLDDQVGQLVNHLVSLGLDKNTMILYLSDNGYHLGNHGLGNKITMHEESVRVPMFIHWADLKSKGVTSNALVSSLDVYPTLLQLAGSALPEHLMGSSLVPLLNNPEAAFREVIFSECTGVHGKPGDGHRMARTHDWKFVLTDVDEEYYFDELSDPWELNNQLDSHDAGDNTVLRKLRHSLADWMKEIGDRNWSRR
jgi:arylsulfatase A-like enzyme